VSALPAFKDTVFSGKAKCLFVRDVETALRGAIRNAWHIGAPIASKTPIPQYNNLITFFFVNDRRIVMMTENRFIYLLVMLSIETQKREIIEMRRLSHTPVV
jgi:hypothetical protein